MVYQLNCHAIARGEHSSPSSKGAGLRGRAVRMTFCFFSYYRLSRRASSRSLQAWMSPICRSRSSRQFRCSRPCGARFMALLPRRDGLPSSHRTRARSHRAERRSSAACAFVKERAKKMRHATTPQRSVTASTMILLATSESGREVPTQAIEGLARGSRIHRG